MIKTDKLYNATNSLIIGVGLILMGILMIFGREHLYINVVNIFVLAVLFLSIKQFINYFFTRNNEKKISFTKSFLNLLFCLVLSLFKNIPLSILPLVFSLYMLLNAIIKFISYYILFKNKANGRLMQLLLGIIYLIVSLPILISPLKSISNVLLIIGIYFILLGSNYILDFITFLIPKRVKSKIKRNIRISLPIVIEAIIPYVVLNEINYLLDKENLDALVLSDSKESDIEPDLEIFVHTSKNGFNRIGHVDLCYNNQVISFGNYDDESVHFFEMIGDGVVFTTEKDKYIPFCIEHSNKTIFSFGLKLTKHQKKNIDKEIECLFNELYEWEAPYEKALRKNKKTSAKKYKDYSSKLYQATNANFYKFRDGKFKNFFVLGVNCCYLADRIIGKSGIDLLKMTGIITPGTYYEYLNREFQKKNSMVISRKIYNQENVTRKTVQDIFKGFSK